METDEDGESSILDTFSLSFVGNFNFANAIDGVRKIVEGIANCTHAMAPNQTRED